MATDKTAVKASTRKARQQGVMALGIAGPLAGGTLESTVFAMLNSARAATPLKTTASQSRTKSPSAKSKPPQAFAGAASTTLPEGMTRRSWRACSRTAAS